MWPAGLGEQLPGLLSGLQRPTGRCPTRRPGDPQFSSSAHQARGRAWILCGAGSLSVPWCLCPRCKWRVQVCAGSAPRGHPCVTRKGIVLFLPLEGSTGNLEESRHAEVSVQEEDDGSVWQ